MRAAVVAVVAGCVGLWGCATTYRGVESVVAEVKQDEVAAAVKMKDEDIGLEGRVRSKTLKAEKAAEASSALGKTKVVLKDENVAYIELESITTQSDKLLCLFEPWAFERLAAIRQGEKVRFVCQFLRIDGEPSERIPVFHNCRVDD